MKKILMIILLMFITMFVGCVHKEYSYNFHFYVSGGEGDLIIKTSESFNPTVRRCSEVGNMCELGCSDDSFFVSLLGGKNGGRELTFIATPEKGYKVKEWTFNGKIVQNNNSNIYTAKVTSEENYNGIITVLFEKTWD